MGRGNFLPPLFYWRNKLADIEHVDIQDPQIHEPKGALAANTGEVYVADGATSGAWTSINTLLSFNYGGMYTNHIDAISLSGIGTTPIKFAGFVNDFPSSGITLDTSNNELTVSTAGVYQIAFSLSFATTASADNGIYQFHVAVDGIESVIGFHREMSGTSDTGSGSALGLLTLAAGQTVSILVESQAAGQDDDIDIKMAQLITTSIEEL